MTIVQEDQILKLQCSPDGQIWYADGMETPASSHEDLMSFVRGLASREHLHVRVLGTHENARLIVELYQKWCSPRRNGVLEVASPTVCETVGERANPEISLYRMRQCRLPPSLGGWHQVNELDYPSYAIAAQLMKDGEPSEHVLRLLETHPVYHDLTFIPTLDAKQAATLIADLLDPRWFIDFQKPDRLSKLKMYLGLSPRYMLKTFTHQAESTRAHRCAITRAAWQGQYLGPTAAMCEDPRNFLWRRFQAAGGNVKGHIRATQAFVTYLVRTWQQQLLSKSTQQLEMFIPDALLRGPEIAAYKMHAARRPKCL